MEPAALMLPLMTLRSRGSVAAMNRDVNHRDKLATRQNSHQSGFESLTTRLRPQEMVILNKKLKRALSYVCPLGRFGRTCRRP
jgi:hypothetical protein